MKQHSTPSKCEYFDILPAGIICIRPDYTVACWNRTVAEWTGISKKEIIGHDLREHFPHLKDRRYGIRIQQVIDGGPAALFSTQFHPHFIYAPLQQGGQRYQRTSVHFFRENEERFALFVIDDVTELVSQVHGFREMKNRALHEVEERKRIEDALRKANRQLKLLTGITRHDILNSVAIAVGYLDLMEGSSESEKETYMERIRQTLEKIQHEIRFTSTYEILGTNEPVWQRIETLVTSPGAPDRIRIQTSGLDVEILADPMLGKVFDNLLDNTIRHGGGDVSMVEVDGEVLGDEFLLTWKDDGAGIDPADKGRIFERGYGKNTGLGLFMIREILSITGITIEETGEAGEGARFEIHVPPGKWRPSPGA